MNRGRVYLDDKLLAKTDWLRLSLGLLIPLSLIAMAAAINLGVLP